MDERKLYQLIDFILNEADSGELDVIRAALRKREGKGVSGEGADLGQRIGRMAKEMVDLGPILKGQVIAVLKDLRWGSKKNTEKNEKEA